MIEDLYLSFGYWVAVAALTYCAMRAIGSKVLDFEFFVLLLLSQYVVHASIAFGVVNKLTVFAIGFYCSYLLVRVPRQLPALAAPLAISKILKNDTLNIRFGVACKLFIIIYFSCRLAFYPFQFGELLLDDRLLAQVENRSLFFLGIAVAPAATGMIYGWVVDGWKLTIIDYLALLLMVIGLIGSGSKAVCLPIVLSLIGVHSYIGAAWRQQLVGITLVATFVAVTTYTLSVFFPGETVAAIVDLLLTRIASNTDAIEYILVNGTDPSSFPFSGVGAILPMISKLFGYTYDYPPGVWLYGTRYGVWTGYGPNSGILMDYYGNLEWFGLAFAILFGAYARAALRSRSLIGCALLSCLSTAFIDLSLFTIAAGFWVSILLLLAILPSAAHKPPKAVAEFGA